jgi:hypothetical protein
MMACKIHQNCAKAYERLGSAEGDQNAAKHLSGAVAWSLRGPDRIMECLIRTGLGAFLMRAFRRPGLMPQFQHLILKAALEEFQNVDKVLVGNREAILAVVNEKHTPEEATNVGLQMNHMRSQAILQGGQVMLMMGSSGDEHTTLPERVGLLLGSIEWLSSGAALFQASAADSELASTHGALEAVRNASCLSVPAAPNGSLQVRNAASCFDIVARAHERLGAMAAVAAKSGRPEGMDNFEKAQRGMEAGLRKALELRRKCGADARAEIRHLPKPTENLEGEAEKQQVGQLAQARSEAQRDRFLETKLMQELGAMPTVQEMDPKEASGFLAQAVAAFGDFADAADPTGANGGPPKEVGQTEMANTLYQQAQFFAKQRDLPAAEKALNQAGSLFQVGR